MRKSSLIVLISKFKTFCDSLGMATREGGSEEGVGGQKEGEEGDVREGRIVWQCGTNDP